MKLLKLIKRFHPNINPYVRKTYIGESGLTMMSRERIKYHVLKLSQVFILFNLGESSELRYMWE